MSWEALTAIGTLLTAVVIAVTVIVAIRQLRLTARQLDHLRRSTQLEGAMAIFADLSSPWFSEAQRFIMNELPEKLKDEQFRGGIALVGRADLSVHREIALMRALERIGAYVKHGLLDGDIIYDVALPVIQGNWRRLDEVVAIHRRALSASMWENFEYLYDNATRWAMARGVSLTPSTDAPVEPKA